MHTKRAALFVVVFSYFAAFTSSLAQARELSFDDRVAAQQAIEQVYWNHRIWPKENPGAKPPLSAVMSDAMIRAKVEDYLKKSNALESWWHRPIAPDQLQAELDRMARDTRDGSTLRQLYEALGNDPFVIAETLARQTLAERLIRNWYSGDTRFHGDLKAKVEAALARCASTDCMRSLGGTYHETTFKLGAEEPETTTRETNSMVMLEADAWAERLRRLATQLGTESSSLPTGRPGRLEETPDAFAVTAVRAQREGEITTATVAWPKRSFDAWWSAERAAVGSETEPSFWPFALPNVPSTPCTNDTWSPTQSGVPDPTSGHTAVWTGTEMIVWGGLQDASVCTGARYTPSTDTWIPTSTGSNMPSPREGHTAVWTGTEMIAWGGWGAAAQTNTGGRYNPATDSWTPTGTGAGVPTARTGHSVVWTGSRMIVWGGGDGNISQLNSGGLYDPVTNTWTATSTTSAPEPRVGHTAVWCPEQGEMIVWGGSYYLDPDTVYPLAGGRYKPSTDTWTATSTGANRPAAREGHTAIWTGTEMIVWGGIKWVSPNYLYLNTGGRYNPSSDSWLGTATGDAPAARYLHTAVWTGTEMIVWGGSSSIYGGNYRNTGGRYSPSSNTWAATSAGANVPPARGSHTAIWTGTEMIVWGGFNDSELSSGGRYSPSADSWTPTSMGSNLPAARYLHAAVWTGTEMIVWGGFYDSYVNSGGRYDAATDTWMPTSTGANVPTPRGYHTAVWTGTEMVVWGGYNGQHLNSGGRYSPSTNSWAATSIGSNVPSARYLHTAVWTGTEVIVWGGYRATPPAQVFDTGGRYSPSTNSWTTTSTGPDVPSARRYHTAVWTGTEMIVWGGAQPAVNTGGRYNPSTDTWTSTSVGTGAPNPRRLHTAVWTGTEMIVWGGAQADQHWYSTGGRYNPSNNTWTATSTGTNVPVERQSHTAVWTGTEMIVWGGYRIDVLNSGGRYAPSTNTWTPTSLGANVPRLRYDHTAAWTGTEMIVWGGVPATSSGGRYCACPSGRLVYRDGDGDGYGDAGVSVPTCDGSAPAGYVTDDTDCDDASGAIHTGGTEICNGRDDDCDGAVDNGIAAPGALMTLTMTKDAAGSADLSWIELDPAQKYDAVRGSLESLRSSAGDYTSSTDSCLSNDAESSPVTDAAVPAVGTAFWYLVRAGNCGGAGTYDVATPFQSGSRDEEIAASANACP